ncbi:MAG: glycosyltransferase family 2 protein [Coprobacter sp.]|nr:glycosyltransferase family 2 protein [Coprobacter sp.]
MKRQMGISLIISTYNRADALAVCVKSALHQSLLPNEIIIADDGSGPETKQIIDKLAANAPIPIIHIWHEDRGFRLAEIRNKAIANTHFQYIIQIDGDIILHRHFIKDHMRFSKSGTFVTGSRILISENATKKILKENRYNISIFTKGIKNKLNGVRCRFLNMLFQNYRHNKIAYSRGCNMAFWKKDLMMVNGYNEDITGWGCEDHELVCRLINGGIRKRTLKFAGVMFHLHHDRFDTNNLNNNQFILENAVKTGLVRCNNGIIKEN